MHIWTVPVTAEREACCLIVYRERASLVRDLGVKAETLYAVSNSLERHYRRVLLPKKDGGVRELWVPDGVLKDIQRRITRVLLVHMPVSPWATAYRCGGGTYRNAAPHAGQPAVLKLDIRHFFDSVRYCDVKDTAFPAEIYAEPLRVLLTMLCYFRQGLPQGAPSSPAISNLVLADFDREIGGWCAPRHVRYTRYCDDLTFSGSFAPEEVIPFVESALRRRGFFLNGGKTRFLPASRRQTVTGLVVNQRPSVPAEELRQLRQEVYYCRRFGPADHMARLGITESRERYLARLLGRVSYALQMTPDKAALREAREWLLEALRCSCSG